MGPTITSLSINGVAMAPGTQPTLVLGADANTFTLIGTNLPTTQPDNNDFVWSLNTEVTGWNFSWGCSTVSSTQYTGTITFGYTGPDPTAGVAKTGTLSVTISGGGGSSTYPAAGGTVKLPAKPG